MKRKTFEEALSRLEEIVEEMEGGAIPLRKGIDLYKEGAELSAFCRKELECAEAEVMELVLNESGEAEFRAFGKQIGGDEDDE